jgi:hypothetical protein
VLSRLALLTSVRRQMVPHQQLRGGSGVKADFLDQQYLVRAVSARCAWVTDRQTIQETRKKRESHRAHDWLAVRSTVVRQQQGAAKLSADANLDLYHRIRTTIHDSKQKLASARAGTAPHAKERLALQLTATKVPMASSPKRRLPLGASARTTARVGFAEGPLSAHVRREELFVPRASDDIPLADASACCCHRLLGRQSHSRRYYVRPSADAE